MSAKLDYWAESVADALSNEGIPASPEQIANIAGAMETSHENYGMAFYSPPAGEHYKREISDLKQRLNIEERKVTCTACNGKGMITEAAWNGCGRSSTSTCWKCRGDGKIIP